MITRRARRRRHLVDTQEVGRKTVVGEIARSNDKRRPVSLAICAPLSHRDGNAGRRGNERRRKANVGPLGHHVP